MKKARDIVASILLNENFQAKTISNITKKAGDTPRSVTTFFFFFFFFFWIVPNKNIVVFDKIVGMIQIENVKALCKSYYRSKLLKSLLIVH